MNPQEQLLNDIKTQLLQYIYRSSETSFGNTVRFMQDASGEGALNWHKAENKEKLILIFNKLITEIQNYNLADGDFRTYLLLKYVAIIYAVYGDALTSEFIKQGYNVAPESVLGSVSDAYSIQPPQNTNFPGIDNISNQHVPIAPKDRLVPSSLFANSSD